MANTKSKNSESKRHTLVRPTPGDSFSNELLPIERLKPHPNNPRKHSAAQITALRQSVRANGITRPFLIDEQDQVIAGHGVLQAALKEGLTHVPVRRLAHFSREQALAYMVADNKLAERSEWDEPLLAAVLKDLTINSDLDIEATGFEIQEADLLIQSLDTNDPDTADEFVPTNGPPIPAIGDLWALGEHKILCGNALDKSSYERLLGSEKANALFTDPPYNVKVNGHVRTK